MKFFGKNFWQDILLAALSTTAFILLAVPVSSLLMIFDSGYSISSMFHEDLHLFWQIYLMALIFYIICILCLYLYKLLHIKKRNLKKIVKQKTLTISKKIKFFRILLSIITGVIYLIFWALSFTTFLYLFTGWSSAWYEQGAYNNLLLIPGLIFAFIHLIIITFIIIRVSKHGNYKYLLFGIILSITFYFWQSYWQNKCYNKATEIKFNLNNQINSNNFLDNVVSTGGTSDPEFKRCSMRAGYLPRY